MVTYWDRLEPELAARKISRQGLATALGISYPAVKKVVDGGAFGSTNNLKLAELLKVNPLWLATGKGPKTDFKYAVATDTTPRPSPMGLDLDSHLTPHSNVEPGPDLRGKVPLISWVQAGDWCHAADPHLPGEADRWLDCPVVHSANTFALRVRGDSMTAPHGRTYPEGCIVFVDPQQRSPNNGERVVACLSGTDEVTFKVYKNEDGRQWLQPLNPMHEPIRSAFHIIGRVLGKWEDD